MNRISKAHKTGFNANELANVFLSRWAARDIANQAIHHLRVITIVQGFDKPQPLVLGRSIKVSR